MANRTLGGTPFGLPLNVTIQCSTRSHILYAPLAVEMPGIEPELEAYTGDCSAIKQHLRCGSLACGTSYHLQLICTCVVRYKRYTLRG